jgi:hypothetical protein
LSVRFFKARADALESLGDAWSAAGRWGGHSNQGSDVRRMHDRVMIDARAPDRDTHLWLLVELGLLLAQSD